MNKRFFTLVTLIIFVLASLSGCLKGKFVNSEDTWESENEIPTPTDTPTEPLPTDTPTPTETPTPTATVRPTHTPTIVPPMISLLDAFLYDTIDLATTSKVVLNRGEKYWIIMSGTYSLWDPDFWYTQGVCYGKTESRPMFPSPKRVNGQVGADPFRRFAIPYYPGTCENGKLGIPGGITSQMMFSLDGGENYSIAIPTIAQYREDHTYLYEVTGQGHPLMIKLSDDINFYEDNTGQILIIIEQIN
jgi:hypothetical protein